MKDYREISSDDQKSWELSREGELIYHILFLLFIFIMIVLFMGVFIFST